MKCLHCKKTIPRERFELLGIETCIDCTPQVPKVKGVMNYSHKTAGTLFITNNEKLFKFLSKPVNRQR